MLSIPIPHSSPCYPDVRSGPNMSVNLIAVDNIFGGCRQLHKRCGKFDLHRNIFRYFCGGPARAHTGRWHIGKHGALGWPRDICLFGRVVGTHWAVYLTVASAPDRPTPTTTLSTYNKYNLYTKALWWSYPKVSHCMRAGWHHAPTGSFVAMFSFGDPYHLVHLEPPPFCGR